MTVRLRYRAPYDWDAMLSFLKARAIDGVECVEGGIYRRTVLLDGQAGTIAILHLPEKESLEAVIRFPEVRALPAIVARIRRVFDLGADIMTVSNHLARDPHLARLIEARPGLRVPGGWDGFEVAMRAILGQQVSVKAGRQLGSKLARICGTTLVTPHGEGLALTFPTAAQVTDADLSSLGMPLARKSALKAVAEAAVADPYLFQPLATVEETVARLSAIRGIGEWTAHYIALRAVREPDAFPASDIGLLRGAAGEDGVRPSPLELQKRAEAWRPWRAYAAQHLWAADSKSA
ncbi:DNA-3-methyladenine glycosylase 2 family protein [Microvirga sp. WGZ8]|uniref:DNA-3-methyladenine glycosylase II n=1 Tax=Microvirga puerhi TaxID=2876078 RepID=A0ABS7VKH4_9HYPH|nr:DNA-3-methyladenine glycosylase 2 family protein [Microvirga puerhi]